MSRARGSVKPAVLVVVLVLVAAALGIGLLVREQAGQAGAPNLLLITVDTLRADHLGVYGYGRPTSPNLDVLARESLLYRRAFSQAPETNPSLSSLMTSHYPHETKVRRNVHQLPPGVMTLAEILKTNGWRTGAVVTNYSLRRGSGFEQGFDDYDDRMEDLATPKWAGIERVAPKATTAAIAWLRQHRHERFFLWLHYMDPHGPYLPPSPYNAMFVDRDGSTGAGESKSLPFLSGATGTGGIPLYAQLGSHTDPRYYVSQYDGEIAFFDHWLGEVIREVRAQGLLERTLVILTADHGEGMGEHEYYFNHPEFLYNGLIHVPLLIRLPGRSPDPKEIATPVALVDVLPTILRLLAIESPRAVKGQDLLALQPKPIFAESFYAGPKSALIADGMKLIVGEDRPLLYDLTTDFYESKNLFDNGDLEALQAAKAMKERCAAIVQQDALGLGPPIKWDILPESLKKLKALGYVQ